MEITNLQTPDAQSYRALMLHAYATAADAFTSTAEERAQEPASWWIRRVADPQGLSQTLGAFVDRELLGCVTVEFSAKPKIRHKAHLLGMFVKASARGQGIGRALVQAALARAAARAQMRVVMLTVTQGNAPALALYERCGFRVFGTEPLAIATAQGYLAKVHMYCELAQRPAPP